MKKFTLLLMVLLTFAGVSIAQTVEDFEVIKMNIFSQGANGLVTFVPNPDQSGINTSGNVGKMVRGKDGDPWAGWYSDLTTTTVNPTLTRYMHIKIWKPRISPVVFKLEGNGGTGDINSMAPQAVVSQWEELVFDLGTTNVEYPRITLIPDFEIPLTLTEDITLYFDDMFLNNDPAVGSAPVSVIENYEFIPLSLLLGDPATDLSTMTNIPNPDKSGINQSDYVIDFLRDKDGVPYGGFYSVLPVAVDVTTNKYVHIMVWKPRISAVRFKLEGGPSGTLEIASTNEQKLTNNWEEMVFDFSSMTGSYPVIALLPDFIDPVGLGEDIHVYFDNIVVNNEPNVTTTVSFKLNMNYWIEQAKFDPTEDFVDVAGSFNEWGVNEVRLVQGTGGMYYGTVSTVTSGSNIEFKFRINGSWDDATCEFPAGGANRQFAVEPGTNIFEAWYNDEVSGIVNPLAGKVEMYPNPVSSTLQINTTVKVDRVIITSLLGKVVEDIQMNSNNITISTSSLNSGLYFVTFVGDGGTRYTQKLMKN